MSATIAVSAIASKLSELAAMRAKTDELQKTIEGERSAALRELPAQFGFESSEDFISAFREANRSGNGHASKPARASANKSNGKRVRASITPERREEIKKWFRAEKGTVLEAVQHFAISISAAQNIKKEAGMVNSR